MNTFKLYLIFFNLIKDSKVSPCGVVDLWVPSPSQGHTPTRRVEFNILRVYGHVDIYLNGLLQQLQIRKNDDDQT